MQIIVLRLLRIVGLIEGLSFVALLGIAMPLKYLADMPGPVRVVGMVHGLLFVLYLMVLLHAQGTMRWPVLRAVGFFLAAVIPLGTFVADRWLQRDLAAAVRERDSARAAA